MSARGAVFFAKIVTSDMKDAVRVSISNYVMDKRLVMYFKETTQHYAFDSTKKCKEGDYALVREIPNSEGKITHVVEKLIYERGNFIDPVTGKKCAGTEYIDDIKRLSGIFGTKQPYLQ